MAVALPLSGTCGYSATPGIDGAIIATALHHGAVPLDWIRRGRMC